MDSALANLKLGPELPDMDGVRKFVLLALWVAASDRASEVWFYGVDRCANGQIPLEYVVNGKCYETSRFPADIRPTIMNTLCEMAGIPVDDRFPLEGIIEGNCDGVDVRWRVVILSTTTSFRLANLRL